MVPCSHKYGNSVSRILWLNLYRNILNGFLTSLSRIILKNWRNGSLSKSLGSPIMNRYFIPMCYFTSKLNCCYTSGEFYSSCALTKPSRSNHSLIKTRDTACFSSRLVPLISRMESDVLSLMADPPIGDLSLRAMR